ncbi:MAG: hypothetical protein GY950_05830 [bacterium]|nr:hypothetical protein [bacterium]
MKPDKKGISVVELLVGLCILAMVIVMGKPSFKATIVRWQVSEGVRTVTSAMAYSRYNAVKMNRSVKFCIEDHRIVLKEKRGGVWEPFHFFDLDEDISVTTNRSPVFSPTGYASPLCSIYVENEYYRYKITLSMAGRIKVAKIASS